MQLLPVSRPGDTVVHDIVADCNRAFNDGVRPQFLVVLEPLPSGENPTKKIAGNTSSLPSHTVVHDGLPQCCTVRVLKISMLIVEHHP